MVNYSSSRTIGSENHLYYICCFIRRTNKGEIKINDITIKKFEEEKKDEIRRNNISIIFQDNNFINDFTAIENVMMPLLIKGKNIGNANKKRKKF